MSESEEISSLSPQNEMVIYDETMDDNGLKACWGPGCQLMAFASTNFTSNESENKDKQSIPVFIHEVKWNIDMFNKTARKLVNESRLVFVAVQSLNISPDENTKFRPQLLQFSRNYRSILRSCSLELQEQYEKAENNRNDMEKQMHLYSLLELIWSLCEILFIENLPDGVVLLQLVEWCKWHFPIADQLACECTSAEDDVAPSDHPKYWDAIFALILQGRTSDVRNLLKLHPSYQTQVYDAFSSIDELLRKMPQFLFHQGQSLNEFEMKWRHWHDECVKRLEEGDFDSHPQLKVICKILCGDEVIISELSDLSGNWYQMLISYLMYNNPTISVYDLHYHSKACIEMCGGASALTPLDNILLAAFKFDIPQVIKECCSYLSSWWLPAHLTDLFYYCGLILPSLSEDTNDMREYLLVEYASSISGFDPYWAVVVDYLSHCGPGSCHYLPLFIQRIPLTSEKKAAKVLRLCEKKGYGSEAQSICRQMSKRALQHNRLGTALSWCIKANDSSFAMFIADKMLLEYAKSGIFPNIDLLDYLGPSVLMADRLTFLAKYRDFHKLYANKKYEEAGSLLLHLLVSANAPINFWPSLLMDCLPLLEEDEVVYGVEETTSLLNCLNILEGNNEVFSHLNDSEKVGEMRKISHLRLALTDNLARAIVS